MQLDMHVRCLQSTWDGVDVAGPDGAPAACCQVLPDAGQLVGTEAEFSMAIPVQAVNNQQSAFKLCN